MSNIDKSNDFRIAIIGDVHSPWHSRPCISWIIDKIKELKPTHVIQIGDCYDLMSYSKFARNPYTISPEQELKEGRAVLEELWRIIQKRSPGAKCHQILGNHEMRLPKRICEKFPEIAHLLEFDHLWTFEGVKTQYDYREPLEIGDILFVHGWLSQLGAHAKYFMKNVVCGHTHRGGVADVIGFDKNIWELNCGFAADVNHEALKYTPNKFNKWTLGMGFIDRHGPRFIRFPAKV